jgi:hypothetical protein
MVRAFDTGNHRVDVAVMLKEIEMTPNFFSEVMGGAKAFTFGTRILGSTFGFYFEVEFMGNLVGLESLGNELPGSLETEAENHDFTSIHAISFEKRRRIDCHGELSQFHSKRRGGALKPSL